MKIPSDQEKEAVWQAYRDRRPTRVPLRWNTNVLFPPKPPGNQNSYQLSVPDVLAWRRVSIPGCPLSHSLLSFNTGAMWGARPPGDVIFLVSLDAGTVRRLAQGKSPSWSPDGSRVVFVRKGRLWTVPRTGGNPVAIHGTYPLVRGRPAWGGVSVRRIQVPAALRGIDPWYVRGVLSRDLNGDGTPEIVLASQNDILMGEARAVAPRFGRAFGLARFEILDRLDVGDINGDGVPEILTMVSTNGSQCDRLVEIHRWNRRRNCFDSLFCEGGLGGSGELRDLDRDGIPEVLSSACSDIGGPEERALSYWTDVYAWNGRRWLMANERFPAVFEQFLQQAKELRKEFKGWEDFETLAENEREARRILHAAKKSGDGMSRDSHRRRST